MIFDALKYVVSLGVEAVGPKKIDVPNSQSVWLWSAQKGLEQVVTPPPLRADHVGDLQVLCHLIANELRAERRPMVVWLQENCATLQLDANDRREIVTLKFTDSIVWHKLAWLYGSDPAGRAFSQNELIKFLRLELNLPEPIIGKFRALQWASGDTGSGMVQRGADKLGRELRAELINAADLPDVLRINAHRFAGVVRIERTCWPAH